MHPYLRERLRDLRNHGFCIVEHQLVMEDESIWGGYSADEFNAAIVQHFDGKPFLIEESPNGDLVVKEPTTHEEMARAICEAHEVARQSVSGAAFNEDGALGKQARKLM